MGCACRGASQGRGSGGPGQTLLSSRSQGQLAVPTAVPTSHLPSPYLRVTRAGLSLRDPRKREKTEAWDFPGGLVAETLSSNGRGLGSVPELDPTCCNKQSFTLQPRPGQPGK